MYRLDVGETGRLDEYRWALFNANTPGDLVTARRHAAGDGVPP
jgi:hypothetical protein